LLQIYDLGGAYIQQLEAGTIETGTLQTRDTVTVGNNLDVSGGLTVSGSARISGGLSVNSLMVAGGGYTGNVLVSGVTFYITNGIIMKVQ
jgi:cytoskeletal protein CcmA (bactofilin family)